MADDLSCPIDCTSQMSVLLCARHWPVFPWPLAKLHVIPFVDMTWLAPVVELAALVLQGKLVRVAAVICITSISTFVNALLRCSCELVTAQLARVVLVSLGARWFLFGLR